MYIRYRVGGGTQSNVAAESIKTITWMDAINKGCPNTVDEENIAASIISSITVVNTIASVAGKDAPTVDEIKAMVKYNSSAQNRCVTVKDYESRISLMPSRYGAPFRVSAIEQNNKIMIYLMMINYLGKLSDAIPSKVIENILNYLSQYRAINDYVEIKAGRIINLSFEVDIMLDKNYVREDVASEVIKTIKEYMDINKHRLGKDIYVGDILKEIGSVDGVINTMDIRIYNEVGSSYSNTQISQPLVNITEESDYKFDEPEDRYQIDLVASDNILSNDADEMFEVKYPEKDIRVRIIERTV
jgi:hypothetical protein